MSNSEPSELELETIEMENAIAMGEALKRLEKNSDFKKIITKGYCEQKALGSVSLLGVPQMRDNRVGIMEDLVSISNLQFYFRWIHNQHDAAKNPVLSDQEEEELAAMEEAEAAGQVN